MVYDLGGILTMLADRPLLPESADEALMFGML
ncbi:MAG: hypothetical protein H6R00_2550 [Proteobacteria bacterium]|nr:hypothetical protein [Pseudomonadota bacterium]